MDDHNAIVCLKRGDLGGLEVLVERYQVRAAHAAYLIVGDRWLAEEIAQSAFVRVAEKIQQFDENRAFAPWFFRIVVNEALKAARRQKKVAPLEADPDDETGRLAGWLADPQMQPEKHLEAKESRQAIRAALMRLTPEQRSVVVMRYFLEMSAAEMSAELDRPTSTIKWWLRAARQRLRSLLRSQGF
jgi:RNA polymerase sigma-70 factor (ECF subfamily)